MDFSVDFMHICDSAWLCFNYLVTYIFPLLVIWWDTALLNVDLEGVMQNWNLIDVSVEAISRF